MYLWFQQISDDFDERQFDEFKFDALQIWRKVQFGEILWLKVQFGEKNLTKDNLTKYLKLYRNISSNCAFRYKYLLNCTFRQFFCTKLYFSSNFLSSKCPEILSNILNLLPVFGIYIFGLRKTTSGPICSKIILSRFIWDSIMASILIWHIPIPV